MTRCEEDQRTPEGHSQLGRHQDKQATVSNKLENKDPSLQVVFGLTQRERARTHHNTHIHTQWHALACTHTQEHIQIHMQILSLQINQLRFYHPSINPPVSTPNQTRTDSNSQILSLKAVLRGRVPVRIPAPRNSPPF